MYQKQTITIDKNSQTAVNFYETQVKSYINYIKTQRDEHDHYGEKRIGSITSDVTEKDENGSLTVTISEDWREVYKNYKSVVITEKWDYEKLLKAYFALDDEEKQGVRMQYARRNVEPNGHSYAWNTIEVFDSANMAEPITARVDIEEHMSLPVQNIVALKDLPNKKWYTARTYIGVLRCNGLMTDPNNDESLYCTSELDNYPTVKASKPELDFLEKNKSFVEEFEKKYCGVYDNESDCFQPYLADTYYLQDIKEFTTSELMEYIDGIMRFVNNSMEVNDYLRGRFCAERYTCIDLSIIMYSDDFDAAEIFYDRDEQKVKCRFYENGKTKIEKQTQKEQPDPEPVAESSEETETTEESDYEFVIMSRYYGLHMSFENEGLADLLEDVETAKDFEGGISIEEDGYIDIYTDADTIIGAFEKAYAGNDEIIAKIRSLIGEKSIEDLCAEGRITTLHNGNITEILLDDNGKMPLDGRKICYSNRRYIKKLLKYEDGKLTEEYTDHRNYPSFRKFEQHI